jgi:putative redox protein
MSDWMDRVNARWQGEGMAFDIGTHTGQHVLADASDEHGGNGLGPTPMQLVLAGLAGCTGMDVIAMLRKMRQPVDSYEVRIRDRRQEEHPRTFTDIEVEHIVRGDGIDEAAVKRAVDLSASKYCPASAALAKACAIRHTYRIEPASP